MDDNYSVKTPASRCRFGVARRDITPPVGIYHRMWGAAKHDRSEGIHRRLTSTAIAMSAEQDPNAWQVFMAVDHCLLLPAEMRQFVQRVCSTAKVDSGRLLVTFSHTHAAGLMDSGRASLPGGEMIATYLEEIAAQTAAAVREAIDAMRPATITYLAGRCDLAAHRDLWDASNASYVCGFNPGQSADDTLLIGQVSDDRNQLVATIVNYACHPTTLAWDNRLISPDYPGAMREIVEQATGVACVFLQGASGDLGPREGFVGAVEVADRNGRQLGYATLATLEAAPPPGTQFNYAGPVVSGATIGIWNHERWTDKEKSAKSLWRQRNWSIDLKYREGLPTIEQTQQDLQEWTNREQDAHVAGNEPEAQVARSMAERARRLLTRLSALPGGQSYPFPIALWQFGDAIWLAVEGEPYNMLQRELRRRFPGIPILVTVLANGWQPGYLPTFDSYDKGIYQESIAVVSKGSLEIVIESVSKQIADWTEKSG